MLNTFGIGRFCRKPELKTVGNSVVAELRLAFNERIKSKKDDTVTEKGHFFDFEVWDKAAELICKHFDKGDSIYIKSATPRQDTWEDKETKEPRSKVYFRLNDFAFLPFNTPKDKKSKE